MGKDYLESLKVLAGYFISDRWPWIRCPNCKMGTLQAKDIDIFEDAASIRDHNDEQFDPEWVYGSFSGRLTCDYCTERVAVIGEMDIAYMDAGSHGGYAERLKVRFFMPALPLISLPSLCPDTVKKRVLEASEVIWMNPNLAANRIRAAIEEVLTDQGIRRYAITKSRKRTLISTHERIQKFRGNHEEVGKFLEAVKWIGNDGSHKGSLTVEQVLDGVELFSHALNLLYGDHRKKLDRLANRINARKGVLG